MTNRHLASAALAAFLSAGPAIAIAADMAIDQLPQEVVQAIQQRFPGATIKEADRETEDGQPVFEVEIDVNGDDKEVKIRPNGEILKVDD